MLWTELIGPATAIIALLFAIYITFQIIKRNKGTPKMQELSKAIHEGAMTFLNKEYRVLIIFVIVVGVILYYIIGNTTALAFVLGAFCSALAGNIGMRVATTSNARTAFAAKKNLREGLKVAFSSGSVMGMCVVGLGLSGVSLLYLYFKDTGLLFGFGFGASSIALFARVGGGIVTPQELPQIIEYIPAFLSRD